MTVRKAARRSEPACPVWHASRVEESEMGIFDRIKSAIFGSAQATEGMPKAGTSGAATSGGTASSAGPASAAATRPAATAATAAAGTSGAAPMSQVDVEAVLTDLATKN